METNPNLMERSIGTDTASVELFFNIFTSGIETFVIPWDQLCHFENAAADWTEIS